MSEGAPINPNSETAESQSATREISRGLISIYKDHTDRGPSAARTTINDHHAVTILECSLTKAERTLVERGDGDLVRQVRRKFQAAMADEIRALVERATGQRALTLLSDHDVARDIAIEVVVFEGATAMAGTGESDNGDGGDAPASSAV